MALIKRIKEPNVSAAANELGRVYFPNFNFLRNLIIGEPIKEITHAMIT
jgi:hypothetical protein